MYSQFIRNGKTLLFKEINLRNIYNYIDLILRKKKRPYLHKLAIESGRYNFTPRNNRFCNACNTDVVEDRIQIFFW